MSTKTVMVISVAIVFIVGVSIAECTAQSAEVLQKIKQAAEQSYRPSASKVQTMEFIATGFTVEDLIQNEQPLPIWFVDNSLAVIKRKYGVDKVSAVRRKRMATASDGSTLGYAFRLDVQGYPTNTVIFYFNLQK